MVWGSLIVWYLFLAGVAAGTFLTSAFVETKYPENKKVKKAGRLMTPVLLAVGLLLLMVDAEAGFLNPLRFFSLYLNPGSVMTIGVYIITVFIIIALISAIMELRGKKTPKALTWVGILFAVGLAVYTGVLLGVVPAYPLWNNAALPILFLVSALSTGIAATSLAGAIFDQKNFKSMKALKKNHAVLLGIEVIVLAMMLIIAGSSGNAATESTFMIIAGSFAPLFWIGVVLVGLVLPLSIELLGMRASRKNKGTVVPVGIVAGTEVGVLLGGFFLRFTIVMAALPIYLL